MDPGRFPKVDLKDTLEEEGIHHSGTYKNVLINDINVRMKWCTTCQFYRYVCSIRFGCYSFYYLLISLTVFE